MKRILLLGASGLVAPHVIPGLEPFYDLCLADVKPHPGGKPVIPVDVSDYAQVAAAAAGMDAILNFTTIRNDPARSFHVNTRGAWHIMKAAVEQGIRKVIHTGPQMVRSGYDHDFDIDGVPRMRDTGYYGVTKMLGLEIAQVYARAYRIQTVTFLFNGLHGRPVEQKKREDFPPFTIVWEDLQNACRLAIEVESVPECYQEFNLLSYLGHGKYMTEKAARMLGYAPREDWTAYFRREI